MWPSSKARLKSALSWFEMKDFYDRKSIDDFSSYIKVFGRPSGSSFAFARNKVPISTQENSALQWKPPSSQRKFIDFVRHLYQNDEDEFEEQSDAESGLKKEFEGQIPHGRQMNVYRLKCGDSRVNVIEISVCTPPSLFSFFVKMLFSGPTNAKGIIVTQNASTLVWMLEETTHVLIVTENDVNDWTREDCCSKAIIDLHMFNTLLCQNEEERNTSVEFLVYKRLELATSELEILSEELSEGGKFEPFAAFNLVKDTKNRWVFEDEEDFTYVSDCHLSPFVRNVADMVEQWEKRVKSTDANANIIVDIIRESSKPAKKKVFGLDENSNPILIHSDRDSNKLMRFLIF